MARPTPLERQQHRAFTIAHAAHQDHLVQQYRVQLGVFEAAIGVSVATVALALPEHGVLQGLLLLAMLWQHHKVGNGFREAISFRQKDVDWAQQELMLAETHLGAEFRTFTRFKVYQDRDPKSLAEKQSVFLSDETRASAEDIARYFYSHKSQSRGKAAVLLALPAVATRAVGLVLVAKAIVSLFF